MLTEEGAEVSNWRDVADDAEFEDYIRSLKRGGGGGGESADKSNTWSIGDRIAIFDNPMYGSAPQAQREGSQISMSKSQASRHLDEIMGQLSDFSQTSPSIRGNRQTVHFAPGGEDSSGKPRSQEWTTKIIPKGECAACKDVILGQVILALNKMWHPEHFKCCICAVQMANNNYFERGGEAYCEKDYHNMFSPQCAQCHAPITEVSLNALGKQWHEGHFLCTDCGQPFDEENGFHLTEDGRPLCARDYFRKHAPECAGCRLPIENNFVTVLETKWHPECFVCQGCHTVIVEDFFFEIITPDGDIESRCIHCYQRDAEITCDNCLNPIIGRYLIDEADNRYHPEHFRCRTCDLQLTKNTYIALNTKPHCMRCYQMLAK